MVGKTLILNEGAGTQSAKEMSSFSGANMGGKSLVLLLFLVMDKVDKASACQAPVKGLLRMVKDS